MHLTPLIDPARRERLAWLAAGDDGRPLGTAFLWLPTAGHTADVQLTVHPAERRRGVGTRLLQALTAAAAEHGMHTLLTEPVRPGEDGFCLAHGFRQVLALTYTRLALRDAAPVAEPVPGYRLVHWEGRVPGDLAETFARARPALDDMPMGDAAYEPQPWDVARLHTIADAVAGRGETLCTTAALDPDGEIAGFTELVIPASGSGDAQHYGTAVLPAHRGHGLARWMKAAQITLVRERFARLDGLLADTADDNTAMRRTNESLGYRPTHRSLLYQLALATAASPTAARPA
ncbi:N-acetyltransferase [Paractinoplanes abujensis]|uniref:GNAT superfamily N-acetyltransferase n=1 Tax=Paractinoplanes abujensis TaxID=882441 RepID=A0A7W7CPV0_9ACTN|nr:GNAT family N-acetyltransferase [Actinoplanes abujensis]MBB4690696.1 GNAT superfamily N-acetyltransferase [Actinoplanes abujensis]GID17891.1 N-acetyltransferase [Actinoplanes abujensis]